MHHLQQQRLTRREAKTLQVESRRARLELQSGGHRLSGRLGACRDDACLGSHTEPRHLLREAVRVGEVAIDARTHYMRTATGRPLKPLFAGQLIEGAANRDQAAAVVARKVTFGRESIARLVDPLIQGRLQVKVDLMMKRNRAGPE